MGDGCWMMGVDGWQDWVMGVEWWVLMICEIRIRHSHTWCGAFARLVLSSNTAIKKGRKNSSPSSL
nr:hypothetical protein [uncultured Prevotella sp.]